MKLEEFIYKYQIEINDKEFDKVLLIARKELTLT